MHPFSKSSAGYRIFTLPELVGLILPNLDAWTLLHAQRVNVMFRNIISKNTACQKVLFFYPEEPAPALPTPSIAADPINETSSSRSPPSSASSEFLAARSNPLLERAFADWFGVSDISKRSFERLFTNPKRREALLRKEASWRRMLVSQPPITNFQMFFWFKCFDDESGLLRRGHIRAPNHSRSDPLPLTYPRGMPAPGAMRMGLLYDLVEEFIGKNPKRCVMHKIWRTERVPAPPPAPSDVAHNTLVLIAVDREGEEESSSPEGYRRPSKANGGC